MKNGCILCGDTGSGKSRTALAYYFCRVCNGRLRGEIVAPTKNVPMFIITTARKRDDEEWEDELKPFKYAKAEAIDSWNNIQKYADVKNAFFIFDEQRVVGYGVWTRSFLKIAKNNQWILLSATPGDKWLDYMPVFIANGFYKNKTDFMNQHVVMSYRGSFPKLERYLDQGILQRHRNDILIDMDYHHEIVVHDETLICEHDRALYKSINKMRWDPMKNAPIKNASELCFLLRKVCNSDPSRIEKVRELMTKHDRIIVFYNHDYEIELFRATDFGIPVAEWNGHKHEPIPDTERWLYFVQYTSGCEGWNCIKTNALIFYSQSYSYKQTKQAAGRIDRMNTPYDELFYYRFRSNAPIDIAIARALNAKKDFNASAFAGLS